MLTLPVSNLITDDCLLPAWIFGHCSLTAEDDDKATLLGEIREWPEQRLKPKLG